MSHSRSSLEFLSCFIHFVFIVRSYLLSLYKQGPSTEAGSEMNPTQAQEEAPRWRSLGTGCVSEQAAVVVTYWIVRETGEERRQRELVTCLTEGG